MKKILIVEDEIIIVRELENILQDLGYRVCVFAANRNSKGQRQYGNISATSAPGRTYFIV